MSDSNCVVCSGTPKCPKCNNDEQCAMSTQTCHSCPRTYCTKLTSTLNDVPGTSRLSSAKIGGIAVGVTVFIMAVATFCGYYFYRWWWMRKHPGDTFKIRDFKTRAGNNEPGVDGSGDGEDAETAWKKARNRVSVAAPSIATKASKASNILNVAYIPGVKIRPPVRGGLQGKMNHTSIMSKGTYLSSIDEASMSTGQIASKGTTPKLIDVAETYDYENTGDSAGNGTGTGSKTLTAGDISRDRSQPTLTKKTFVKSPLAVGFTNLTPQPKMEPLGSDTDEDTDSDADSDAQSIEKIIRERGKMTGEKEVPAVVATKKMMDPPGETAVKTTGEPAGESTATGKIAGEDAVKTDEDETSQDSKKDTTADNDSVLLEVDFDDDDDSTDPFSTPFD